MSSVVRSLRAELGPMFALAWPVAAAELGWMAMGLVDTMLVGRVGAEAIGAVLEGVVATIDAATGLARVDVAGGALSIEAGGLAAGQRVRLQLLARDLILATERPRALSVRNALAGRVAAIEADGAHAALVHVDAGGTPIIVRVTAQACEELSLRLGSPVWVLVKAVTLRTHVFQAAATRGG